MRRSANLFALGLGAATALIASLIAILFTNDIGTLLYLVAVALLGVGLVGLSLGVGLRKGSQMSMRAVAAFVAFLAVTAVMVLNQSHFRPHLFWLAWSHRYKSEVLATSAPPNGEFRHIEWEGDGWGSGATGDWMGYIVFAPSDSLSVATKSDVPGKYSGVPCTVIRVRRLERQWYSVVLDMNQFWDKMHPDCEHFRVAVDKSSINLKSHE